MADDVFNPLGGWRTSAPDAMLKIGRYWVKASTVEAVGEDGDQIVIYLQSANILIVPIETIELDKLAQWIAHPEDGKP